MRRFILSLLLTTVLGLAGAEVTKVHAETVVNDKLDTVVTTIGSKTIEVKSYEEIYKDLFPRLLRRDNVIPTYTIEKEMKGEELNRFSSGLYSYVWGDNTSLDGVDLYYSAFLSNYSTSIKYSGASSVKTTLKLTFNYSNTRNQEVFVNKKIEKIIRELNLDGKSDYDKIYKIYNWISENVNYAYLSDGVTPAVDYNGAYHALKYGSAVCSGYASLLERMLTKAGFACETISGFAENDYGYSRHAWNVVKLDGKWYHLDITWDDTDDGEVDTDYFLKSSEDLLNHYLKLTKGVGQLRQTISKKSYVLK